MTRPDLHTLTGAYAVDALTGRERVEFGIHLRECEACAREVGELEAPPRASAPPPRRPRPPR